MGKVKTRFLGDEDLEKKQIEEQKKKSQAKKAKETGDLEEVAVDTIKKAKLSKAKERKNQSVSKRKRGKNYRQVALNINNKSEYALADAVELVKKSSYAKFDETIELHLNIEKEGLKGEVVFPHSTGKTLKVEVLNDSLLEKIESGIIDFDILVASPSQMPKLAKFARVLGPKGLMPNPKTGTVSNDPEKTAETFRQGSVRWKSESKFPIIHQVIGKKSFENQKIVENIDTFIKAVGTKNILSAYIAGSMTPSVKIAIVR